MKHYFNKIRSQIILSSNSVKKSKNGKDRIVEWLKVFYQIFVVIKVILEVLKYY